MKCDSKELILEQFVKINQYSSTPKNELYRLGYSMENIVKTFQNPVTVSMNHKVQEK